MKFLFIFIFALLFVDCGSKKVNTTNSADTRTEKVKLLDKNTYLLSTYSNDSTYAFTEGNPVKVGGINQNEGPTNEGRFLRALLGPKGQKVYYQRAGSCCFFKTPNGFDGSGGVLDRYEVWYTGSKDTFSIYINMYDKGNLYIPIGFKAKIKP